MGQENQANRVCPLTKFGLGRVDCKQSAHVLSRVLHRDVNISAQTELYGSGL
jgi:hypothetical protein